MSDKILQELPVVEEIKGVAIIVVGVCCALEGEYQPSR